MVRTKLISINLQIKEEVDAFSKGMFYALFDPSRLEELKDMFVQLAAVFSPKRGIEIWNLFQSRLESIQELVALDAVSIEANDPAARSLEEVYLAYPGFQATVYYRLSHELWKLGLPILPRMISEYAHGLTGVDIHPGAKIGRSFFIDHATGIVIGETAEIGNEVKIYQGVTLGSLQVKKSMSSQKRHPSIGDRVTIYANATILGGETIVGNNTIIGANVWITQSIPSDAKVYHEHTAKVVVKKN